jgi:endoglucanase
MGERGFRATTAIFLRALAIVACSGDEIVAPTSSSEPFVGDTPPGAPAALVGSALYVAPSSPAQRQADAWRSGRPADAVLMDRIASQPIAIWLGAWSGDVRTNVRTAIARAGERMPVFVLYNIPKRDCGGYSAGGGSPSGYLAWVRRVADGIGGGRAVTVLEPDALAQLTCLSRAEQDERLALLRSAVGILKSAGAVVYVDAGNARWVAPSEMAARLARVSVGSADGFALNVSNFVGTGATRGYGEAISRSLGGKHFIIDTSRNGMGGTSSGQWCNPPGQALGALPTTRTGHQLVDAYLWIKPPGESDGPCNGGPAAGTWWAEYALGLAKRQSASSAVASRSNARRSLRR